VPGNNEEQKLEAMGSLRQCGGQGLTSRCTTLTVMNHLQRTFPGFLGSKAIAVRWCILSLQANKLYF